MNDEYTLRISDEVISMIRAFCTPLGDTLDEHLFEAITRKSIKEAVIEKKNNMTSKLPKRNLNQLKF